jgi:hypothetical protein
MGWPVCGAAQSVISQRCTVELASAQESSMFNFDVEEMSECDAAIAIAKAVLAVDDAAVVCL